MQSPKNKLQIVIQLIVVISNFLKVMLLLVRYCQLVWLCNHELIVMKLGNGAELQSCNSNKLTCPCAAGQVRPTSF